jgi:hypothetical protein
MNIKGITREDIVAQILAEYKDATVNGTTTPTTNTTATTTTRKVNDHRRQKQKQDHEEEENEDLSRLVSIIKSPTPLMKEQLAFVDLLVLQGCACFIPAHVGSSFSYMVMRRKELDAGFVSSNSPTIREPHAVFRGWGV